MFGEVSLRLGIDGVVDEDVNDVFANVEVVVLELVSLAAVTLMLGSRGEAVLVVIVVTLTLFRGNNAGVNNVAVAVERKGAAAAVVVVEIVSAM